MLLDVDAIGELYLLPKLFEWSLWLFPQKIVCQKLPPQMKNLFERVLFQTVNRRGAFRNELC